jgi:hypothetical protein
VWVDNFSTYYGPFGIIVGGDIGRLGRAVLRAAHTTSISSTSWSSTSVREENKDDKAIEDAPEGENKSPAKRLGIFQPLVNGRQPLKRCQREYRKRGHH